MEAISVCGSNCIVMALFSQEYALIAQVDSSSKMSPL
jgi:hypothetical protein